MTERLTEDDIKRMQDFFLHNSHHPVLPRLIEEWREIKRQLDAANLRVDEAREIIQKVLDDEESRPGAWGPDVTCVGYLRLALEALHPADKEKI